MDSYRFADAGDCGQMAGLIGYEGAARIARTISRGSEPSKIIARPKVHAKEMVAFEGTCEWMRRVAYGAAWRYCCISYQNTREHCRLLEKDGSSAVRCRFSTMKVGCIYLRRTVTTARGFAPIGRIELAERTRPPARDPCWQNLTARY